MYRCRKNQASLTTLERSRFVAAVLALKANGKYDQYVQDHLSFMPYAHRGPAFFPWHREFLRRYELDLQAIDATVTLPYWDWTVDNSAVSSLWNIDFMGGDGRPSDGQVMTGPFAFSAGNWTLAFDGPALRRRFGLSAPTLPTPSDVTTALGVTPYDVSPYTTASASGFRNRAEGWISGPQLHNRVHVWVGGSMAPASSPNDPVFFLHHCFVDKLWADWQALHPGEPYVPVTGAAPGHNLNDAMEPWAGRGETVTPASVLDHHALGYAYDTESVCAATLKFRDDPLTLKFRDDLPTLKFRDDPIKLKFFDDGPTLKFRDDLPTLKFRDDLGTAPQLDPIKQPDLDKPPPTDAPKLPGLDKAGGADVPGPPGSPGGREAAPFVLATPHHSMAWARTGAQAQPAGTDPYEAVLAQYEQALHEFDRAYQQGLLAEADLQAWTALHQEYQALLAEYRAQVPRRR